MIAQAPFGDRDEFTDDVFEHATVAEIAERSFYRCVFRNVTLVEAALDRCVFEDCSFDSCDATMMTLGSSSFRGVSFIGCKLMGIDFTRAHQLSFSITAERCVLSYSTFAEMKLRDLRLLDCKALETNFSEADLTRADFSGTDLTGATFWHSVLRQTDLSSASGYSIDPQINELGDSRFSLEGLISAARHIGIIVPHLRRHDDSEG